MALSILTHSTLLKSIKPLGQICNANILHPTFSHANIKCFATSRKTLVKKFALPIKAAGVHKLSRNPVEEDEESDDNFTGEECPAKEIPEAVERPPPETHLSAVLHAPSTLKLEMLEKPKHKENEVLVAVECVGIGGIELRLMIDGYVAHHRMKQKMIMGHEASGIVEQIGKNVTKLKVGERVAINPNWPCNNCEFCKAAKYNLCPKRAVMGFPSTNGALTRYVACPEDVCCKLPKHISFEEAALLEPLSVANNACDKGGITMGSNVLISGAGPLGLLTLLCARYRGADTIVVTDTLPNRLRYANKFKADRGILIDKGASDAQVTKEIVEAFRGEPDVSIDCSGAGQAIKIASEITRPGGTAVLTGYGKSPSNIPTFFSVKNVTIRGCVTHCNKFQQSLDLLAAGRFSLKSVITHHYKLMDLSAALKTAASGEGIKVMVHPNPEWSGSKKCF